MVFFRILLKIISFLFFFLKFRSLKTAFLFSHYNLPLSYSKMIKRSKSSILFLNSGNSIPISQLFLFKSALSTLFKVLNCKEAIIEKTYSKGFLLNFNTIYLNVFSVENIATVKEIFLETIYDIRIPDENAVFIDIGLNVGYASLYFSSNNKISHIYSYEPFLSTFNEANKNLLLNPILNTKISPVNKGISDYSGIIKVPLYESGSAIASTNDVFINHTISDKNKLELINVEIENIINVLNDVFIKHPLSNIFIKLDCEGEEYKIIEAIDNPNFLNKIKGLIIEWHILGPNKIIEVLIKHNYCVMHFPRHVDMGLNEAKTGMIYAFK